MGLIQKIRERRTLNENSLSDTLRAALLGGEALNKDEAANIPSLSACVKFIAGKVAELPIKLYKESGEETEELADDTRVRLLNDSTGDLLDVYQMKYAVVKDYLLYGAGYIYPERQRNSFVSLRYIKNSAVSIVKNSDPIFKKADFLVQGKQFRDDELIRVLRDSEDGVTGLGIIKEANELLTVIYRSMIFEKYLVANGGNKKGFLKSARKLDKEAMDSLKEAWEKLYSNNGNNMMFLNNGIEFQESSNTSVEMQLNENKKSNNDYVCEIFNLSPSVVSGAANDEAYTAAIKTAVMPVIRAFEAALNKGLLLESEKHTHYFSFDTGELLKGDILKRYQAYQIGLSNNFLQTDEVRYKEDLKPLGFNFIRLGLQDVLLDPKTNTIYTPNTNQTTMFGKSSGFEEAIQGEQTGEETLEDGENEEVRGRFIQDPKTGKMQGSKSSGGSGGGSAGTSESKESKEESENENTSESEFGSSGESGISSKQSTKNSENSVDLDYISSEEYHNKFKGITGDRAVDEQIYRQSKAILTHRSGTYKEDMCLIDSVSGKVVGKQSHSNSDFGVEYNESLTNAISKYPSNTLISIHNHPTNNPPTGSDLVSCGNRKYKKGIVVTHNGKVYSYKVGNKPFTAEIFGTRVDKYRSIGYNEVKAIELTLNDYVAEYGIEWEEHL